MLSSIRIDKAVILKQMKFGSLYSLKNFSTYKIQLKKAAFN